MQNVHDVLIIGAGPVGLCFARALSQLGLSIVLCEKQTRDTFAHPQKDGRDIALTHLSVDILKKLGVWQHIPEHAISIIREARVYNGRSSHYMQLATNKTDQLAFIVANYLIREALYNGVKDEKHIIWVEGVTLKDLELQEDHTIVRMSDDSCVKAKLVVAADSRFSEARKKMGISTSMQDFGKVMVVCQMEHDVPHKEVAQECFLYDNTTIAALPLIGSRSSVIITLKPLEAKKMTLLPANEFNLWVAQKLQYRLGNMRLDSERYAHPLVGVYPNRFIAQRFALLGDAAVGMHPVTAHGFNFGLKGQDILASCIEKANNMGKDIGSKGVLMRYQNVHQQATRFLYLATNSIVGLYTNDSPPFKLLRSTLLRIANRVTPIKSFLMSKLVEKC